MQNAGPQSETLWSETKRPLAPNHFTARCGEHTLIFRLQYFGHFGGKGVAHDVVVFGGDVDACRVALKSETARAGRYSLLLNARFCFLRRRFSLVSSRYPVNYAKQTAVLSIGAQ